MYSYCKSYYVYCNNELINLNKIFYGASFINLLFHYVAFLKSYYMYFFIFKRTEEIFGCKEDKKIARKLKKYNGET